VKDKYQALMNHLQLASRLAREAAGKVDDGGSANLDAIFVKLPRYNEDKTIEAIHQAGLSGYKTTWIGGNGFMINPPAVGQGNKRAKAQEIMLDYLGRYYKVFGYYQMD
jgi:hypothetical protein